MAIEQEGVTGAEAARRLAVSASTLRRKMAAIRNEDGTYPWPAIAWGFLNESLTQGEVASRLTITTSWVRELSRRGVLTRNEDGSYPWPRNQDEYEAFRSSDEEAGEASDAEGYKDALTRLTREKADGEEMKNRLRRRELMEVTEVADRVRQPLEAVNTKLRTAKRRLGKTWAKKLGISQAEAMALIDELVEDVRADLRTVFE